jgi:molecular chaperone GrpE
MAEQPSKEHAPGMVVQAWTPGWTLNGRLLRPAMVVVAKAAPEKGDVVPKSDSSESRTN